MDALNALLKKISLAASFLLAVVAMSAVAADVKIVIPDGNPNLLNLAKATQHALEQTNNPPSVFITTPNMPNTANSDTLAIVIGDELIAWSESAKNPFRNLLYFYISSIEFNRLNVNANKTALFRDQPLSRQLFLTHLILPNVRRALVIHRAEQFATNITRNIQRGPDGLTINYRVVDAGSDWIKSMAQWVTEADVLVCVDDQKLYNRDTIRSTLLTTYRQGKVLIGPNRGFVNAGSLASTYTSPEHYLQQLQKMVDDWRRQKKLPDPQFPEKFQLVVNQQVAESLGLPIPDEQELLRVLQRELQTVEGCGNGCP